MKILLIMSKESVLDPLSQIDLMSEYFLRIKSYKNDYKKNIQAFRKFNKKQFFVIYIY